MIREKLLSNLNLKLFCSKSTVIPSDFQHLKVHTRSSTRQSKQQAYQALEALHTVVYGKASHSPAAAERVRTDTEQDARTEPNDM